MKPYLHSLGTLFHFQWNLDTSVGKGGQNSNAADISYLQWYYALAANFAQTPPDRVAIYKQVVVNGICTGGSEDPLVRAITVQQRGLNHPQIDGKASVAPPGGRIGQTAYFILRLGARFATRFPQAWPRLDKIPNCPPIVAEAVNVAIPKLQV